MSPPLGGPAFVAWGFALGACIGSFLNVVVARVPAGLSIVRPGSRCPRCLRPIRWYDNIPVLSWLALRARCRGCGQPISARYPLVELLGGVAGAVVIARHGLAPAAFAELALAETLLALAFIDLDTWLLPDVMTWPLGALGLLLSPLAITPAGGLRAAALGAGLGFTAFGALWLFGEKVLKKEALGFGDVWLLAALGAWLGPAALLPVVLFASVQGAVVGIALLALGRGEPGPPAATEAAVPPPPGGGEAKADEEDWVPPRHAVPFGPFLALGALEWLWLGDAVARLIPALQLLR